MLDLNDLYYYVQVVNHGGFASAGRALNLPKSKLSRRIALLEERLGVRLIQRSTRRFSVTEIGQTYYEHCNAMIIEAEAAQNAIEVIRSQPCGIVRIACPVALVHAHVGMMIADFMASNPQVKVYLEVTNRRVDPIEESIDLAIRVRPLPLEDSNLVIRVLAGRSQCLVSSPQLLIRHGIPQLPTDLLNWPTLGLGPAHEQHTWTLHGPNSQQITLHYTPRLVTSDMITLRNAALIGIGIVQLPSMVVRQELTQGKLVPLLPEWTPQREIIHAIYPSRRGLLPSVRALIDYLSRCFDALVED